MTEKTGATPEATIRDIKRKTRRKFTAEEKIRIVLQGMRGERSKQLPNSILVVVSIKPSWHLKHSYNGIFMFNEC